MRTAIAFSKPRFAFVPLVENGVEVVDAAGLESFSLIEEWGGVIGAAEFLDGEREPVDAGVLIEVEGLASAAGCEPGMGAYEIGESVAEAVGFADIEDGFGRGDYEVDGADFWEVGESY